MTYVVVNHTTIWSRPPRRGRRGRDHMVVWSTTTYVIYYWNTRGRGGRDHMVVWFKTTASCISVIYDICSCKSHYHMITTTTASCISVIHDICSCKSQYHMITITEIQGAIMVCHILLKYKGPWWSWSYGGVIYKYTTYHDGSLYFSNTWHM
jgi:hypothetical protein